MKKHLNIVIDYFKNKKNLTMVLGAGGQKHDYTIRFKRYIFLVTGIVNLEVSKRYFTSKEKLLNYVKIKKLPVPIPLDFNKGPFLAFLSKLRGRFKEIIFDLSVTKFVRWKRRHLRIIYRSLHENGRFYTDWSGPDIIRNVYEDDLPYTDDNGTFSKDKKFTVSQNPLFL